MKYSVIVPVFNEEGNVAKLYEEIKDVFANINAEYEIIFINDGSTDDTRRVLVGIKGITVISFRRNYGQTASLSVGFRFAKGDLLITLDGDLQNDPSDIPSLIKKLNEGYDVVCGWRIHRKDKFSKRIVSWGAAQLRKVFINDGIHDSGCTLRIYRKECFEDPGFGLYGEMHRFIPGILKSQGFRIAEIEVNHRNRRSGKSKYTWVRILKGIVDMVILFFWRKYSARPIHVFGGIGLMSTVSGSLMLMILFILRLMNVLTLADRIWPIIGILLIIVGVQLFVSGIIADIAIRIYYSKEEFKPYLIKEIIETS